MFSIFVGIAKNVTTGRLATASERVRFSGIKIDCSLSIGQFSGHIQIARGSSKDQLYLPSDRSEHIGEFGDSIKGWHVAIFPILLNLHFFFFLFLQSSSKLQIWERFLRSIFYVGKGKNSRPYSHLYDAIKLYNRKNRDDGETEETLTPQFVPRDGTKKNHLPLHMNLFL